MPLFPRYEYEGYGQGHKLDLTNIPKECVTVSVDIRDEKLSEAIRRKITSLEASRELGAKQQDFALAYRASLKLEVLQQVMKEAGL
ncbi:hypothetical protein AB5J55_22660 [Streptomyces sp. R11]|uniref:Uncharacterized protein n=1 Tax=Streptomyces sp. R11 TaxID=3238625 RepID=A0AB39N5L9_9ACTN